MWVDYMRIVDRGASSSRTRQQTDGDFWVETLLPSEGVKCKQNKITKSYLVKSNWVRKIASPTSISSRKFATSDLLVGKR